MVTDTAELPPQTNGATADKTGETASEKASAFVANAREKAGEAFDTTVDTVKKNPVTAAAIATGAVAAVAGALFGATKLRKSEDDTGSAAKKPKTKAS